MKGNLQSPVSLTPFESTVDFHLFYPTGDQSNDVFHCTGVLSLSRRRKSLVCCNWSTLNAHNSLNFRPIEIKKKKQVAQRDVLYLPYFVRNIVGRHPVYRARVVVRGLAIK